MVTIQNNFDAYKSDFKKDTGLDSHANPAIYIAYYNARVSDVTMQLTQGLLREIMNNSDTIINLLRQKPR